MPKNHKYTLEFQDLVMRYQTLKEYNKELNKINTIFLYDRSILDNYAYLNNYDDFKYLLNKNNISELNYIDKFDLVINLSSLSNFEEFEYENDDERKENRDFSKYLDYKTSTSYLTSRNLKIVYPTKDINDKYDIILNHIIDLINKKNNNDTIQYEVDVNKSYLNQYCDDNSKTITIKDIYLNNYLNDNQYILSHRIYKNEESFILTKITNNSSESVTISKDEYKKLLKKYNIDKEVLKNELSFIYDYKKYKLVIYENGETYLEIDNSNFLSDIKIPENIVIKKNLEKIKKYDNI